MTGFEVTINQLGTKADNLNTMNQTFQIYMTKLQETEAALNTMWEGPARETFHNAFAADLLQMENFYKAVNNYVIAMKNASTRYAQAETSNVDTASRRTYA